MRQAPYHHKLINNCDFDDSVDTNFCSFFFILFTQYDHTAAVFWGWCLSTHPIIFDDWNNLGVQWTDYINLHLQTHNKLETTSSSNHIHATTTITKLIPERSTMWPTRVIYSLSAIAHGEINCFEYFICFLLLNDSKFCNLWILR